MAPATLTPYPVHVPDDSPALKGLVPFDLPGRPDYLPDIYQYQGNHPLREVWPTGHHTFIYFVDTSDAGKRDFADRSSRLSVPKGPNQNNPSALFLCPSSVVGLPVVLDLAGYLHLRPGDLIAARDKDGDGDPEMDVIQGYCGER